jgi:hypothetical protein
MPALHIRDISDTLLKRLKSEAALSGMTLREYVIRQLDGAEPRRADESTAVVNGRTTGQRPASLNHILSESPAEMPDAPPKVGGERRQQRGATAGSGLPERVTPPKPRSGVCLICGHPLHKHGGFGDSCQECVCSKFE